MRNKKIQVKLIFISISEGKPAKNIKIALFGKRLFNRQKLIIEFFKIQLSL